MSDGRRLGLDVSGVFEGVIVVGGAGAGAGVDTDVLVGRKEGRKVGAFDICAAEGAVWHCTCGTNKASTSTDRAELLFETIRSDSGLDSSLGDADLGSSCR